MPLSIFLFGMLSEYVSIEIKTEFLLISGAFLLFGICLIQYAFWEKCFSYLIIRENFVVWKCPLRKSISVSCVNCYEIGLEYEDAYVKNIYPYIYFVSFPYSKENSKYYGKVKCKKGLIKFRYTNKLAKYVITNYPNKVSYSLSKYYRDHKKEKTD